MRRLLLLPIALLALLLIPGAAAAEEAEPTPMSIQFPQRHADLLGPRALVPVECSGLTANSCEGTLVLKGIRGAHKVPFALQLGERRFLTVPLGDHVERGRRVRVVARTLQLTGRTVRTSSVLRIG
ncbi:MAG TPA: hypothetical protein VFK14_06760 [Solirubrobacterales bacterium]|nr:hypothetical protein [Solirubrobacterales bacterium]